jgi:hypothetical protein
LPAASGIFGAIMPHGSNSGKARGKAEFQRVFRLAE